MCQDELGPETLVRGLYYKEHLDDYQGIGTQDGKPEFICWTNEPEKLVLATLAGKTPNLIGYEVVNTSWFTEKGKRGRRKQGKSSERLHAPTLDFDFPCRLVPSSSPGHFHFYIDKLLSKETYLELLAVMEKAGLIQWGVNESAKVHGQTYLRWNTTKQSEGLI